MLVGVYVEDYEAMCASGPSIWADTRYTPSVWSKEAGDVVRTAIHDFEGDQTESERHGHRVIPNATFSEATAKEHDAPVIPGGRAPECIHLNERLAESARHFPEADSSMADIRHGPRVRAATGVVERRGIPPIPRQRQGSSVDDGTSEAIPSSWKRTQFAIR